MANAKKNIEAAENEALNAENTSAENNTVEKTQTKTFEENSKKGTTDEVISTLDKVVNSVSNINERAENNESAVRRTELRNEEEIAVRSVTFGGLSWISPRTNAHYRWNEIGSVEFIPFGELITMNNTARDFLFAPLVIIQDSRVVEYFRLKATYEKIACIDKLEDMFNKGDLNEIGAMLRSIVNTNMRDIAISKIRTLRGEHKLNNIDIIRMIEKILCFDMN